MPRHDRIRTYQEEDVTDGERYTPLATMQKASRPDFAANATAVAALQTSGYIDTSQMPEIDSEILDLPERTTSDDPEADPDSDPDDDKQGDKGAGGEDDHQEDAGAFASARFRSGADRR